jgi:predicted permease
LVIVGVYFFVLIGFAAKRIFREIDEKTLVLLSVYFLQPMLAFWGIFGKKIESSDFLVPAFYFAISIVGALAGFLFFSKILSDKRDVSIVTAAGILGNTGNLGIPLLIAIFGKSAAFYAVLINMANVFVLYIVGVLLYSLGSSTVKDSVKNILTMPVIWFSILAIVLNFSGVVLNDTLYGIVEMGAHASICLQLIIFGVFIGGLSSLRLDTKLTIYAMAHKFILIPSLAFVMLHFAPMDHFLKVLIFLQVCMPLAVSNVNLALLYDCKPYIVTGAILISSLLFLFFAPIYSFIFS